MGCDIHGYIEIKKNGKWEYYNWRDEKYKIGEYEDGSTQYSYDGYFDEPLYIGRNYDLFAILADVRNGRGFAGIKTGEGFTPMSQPKGLPHDVSEAVLNESKEWNGDGHSHSFFILRELLAYDYVNQFTVQYGMVSEDEYKVFREKGKPNGWCGDVDGRRVIKLTNEQMEDLLSGELPRNDATSYYTSVSWRENYHQACGEHWFVTLQEMQKLGDPDNVRLVFWFDN